MTDSSDVLFILGKLDGKLDALVNSVSRQDLRIDEVEGKLNGLVVKVALISGAIGGGAGLASSLITI